MSLDTTMERLEGGVAPAEPLLTVSGLRKIFTRHNGTKVPAIDGVDLEVGAGEFVVLLGPSGCGKTTLLRCIGGLETASEGVVQIGDKVVFDAAKRVNVSTRLRGVSMVFQSYALWPNMTVFANIAYPLKSKRSGKRSKAEIREAVEEIARVVGIEEILNQYPSHISGGQQQRVALARALVSGSALVLFDEPLSNVDAKVRKELRIELAALQGKFGFAAVYVTHDQDDAMELADRIVVLDAGKISQVGPPDEIYSKPANKYVASFVGSTNHLAGTVLAVDAEGVSVDTSFGLVRSSESEGLTPGQAVDVLFRPQHAELHEVKPSVVNAWQMTFRRKMNAGTHAELIVTHDHEIYQLRVDAEYEPPASEEIWVSIPPSRILVYPAAA